MGNPRPLLYSVGFILLIGLLLNVFVAPFVSIETVDPNSILYGVIDFIENGITITVPVVGEFTISPVTWLWLGIDGITDAVVDQLELLSFIPDKILIIILIISSLSLAYSVVSLIRGN